MALFALIPNLETHNSRLWKKTPNLIILGNCCKQYTRHNEQNLLYRTCNEPQSLAPIKQGCNDFSQENRNMKQEMCHIDQPETQHAEQWAHSQRGCSMNCCEKGDEKSAEGTYGCCWREGKTAAKERSWGCSYRGWVRLRWIIWSNDQQTLSRWITLI